MATSTIVAALQDIIEERLVPDVQDTLLKIEPIFDAIPVSSAGVRRLGDDGISRGWAVRHVFSSGVSGQLSWGSPSADTLDTTLNQVQVPSTGLGTSRWPDPTEIALKGLLSRVIPMAKGYGNLTMPLEVFQADELTAGIMQYVEANLRGAAHNFALMKASALLAATSGAIAIVGPNVTDGGTGVKYVTCDVTGGRIGAFEDGMKVDIIKADTDTMRNGSDATYANRHALFVDGVDPIAGTVRFAAYAANFHSQVATGDSIFPADSYVAATHEGYRAPMGLNDWILGSGTLFEQGRYAEYVPISGIALGANPKFKSLVDTGVGVLTEAALNGYIAQYLDAYGYGLDTIITTRGVLEKYYQQPSTISGGRQFWDRTGAVMQFMSGRAKIKYQYEGRDFGWYISNLCPPETLYAIQRQGNLRQYQPPAIPSSTGGPANFGPALQFVGKALGWPDDWIGVFDSSAKPLAMKQAPFNVFYQILPDVPQSIKLTGVTEA